MSDVPDLSGVEVTPETVRRLFRQLDRPVMTASDMAEAFGMTGENANYHLRKMVDNGMIRREKVGAAAVVYWLPPSSETSQETEAAI
jgi:predicted transcriptional regulator